MLAVNTSFKHWLQTLASNTGFKHWLQKPKSGHAIGARKLYKYAASVLGAMMIKK